jgi:hypothetical protein
MGASCWRVLLQNVARSLLTAYKSAALRKAVTHDDGEVGNQQRCSCNDFNGGKNVHRSLLV